MLHTRIGNPDNAHGIKPPHALDVTSTKRPRLLRRDMLSEPLCSTNTASQNTAHLEMKNYAADNYLNTEYHDTENIALDDDDGISIEAEAITNSPTLTSTTGVIHSVNQKWTVALLQLLNEINAPDYAFSRILKWGRDAKAEGYTFNPLGGLNRNRNIALIYDSLHNAEKLRPSVQTIHCPTAGSSDVIIFEFAPQLLYLLQNPLIMTAENLIIDPMNPLARYNPPDGRLGEACSGTVYQNAYDRLITNPKKQFFVPIIQWIDRTSTTGNDRFTLKPYMFTPAIFREEFRRTITAWGYHGFLPRSKTSPAQNVSKRQGDNIRTYHAQLSAALQSFQFPGPYLQNVVLPLGPTGSICVDIVTCVLYIIQDMQEGDMLCGRFGPHTSLIQRQCRACNIGYFELNDPYVECRYLYAAPMQDIARLPDARQRQRWSQHRLENVYNNVELGDPTRGIFGATPVDTLHGYRKGMIEVVINRVLDNISPKKKAALDHLAVSFHKSHRQTCRKNFPKTEFACGVSSVTKKSAAELAGLLFMFVILVQYDVGWAIVSASLEKQQTDLADILELFEAMLCFDAWLNKPTYWILDDTKEESKASMLESLRQLMTMCVDRILPRRDKPKDENPWNFPKFHELLHLGDDMERYGASINFSAQRPESLLIPAAKLPGKRAQKRHDGSSYEIQSAQRLADTHIINTMYIKIFGSGLWQEDDKSSAGTISESTGRATFMDLTRSDNKFHVSWSSTTSATKLTVSPNLLSFLCDNFGDKVRCATEYKREEYTFRCHPSFQSDGCIYDWMKVIFDGDPPTSYPCRLAMVVIMDNPADPYRLVVQSATERTYKDSTLLKEWTFSPEFYIISPESIERPCFVIMISPTDDKILEALPYDEWPSKFTDA